MLVPSHRHTAADLELWAELERADFIHAERIGDKIECALAEIEQFNVRPAYCSVSWGKDSVVTAHLVARAAYETLLAHLVIRATTAPNPDCVTVRDEYLKITRQSYIERDGRDTHQHDFQQLAKAAGTNRYISGVRAAESGQRRLSARYHGTSTEQACRPLLWWSVQDVFAYLALFRLPVHPAYAMLGGGRWQRDQLRVASLGGCRGDGRGRAEWEREYYGDVIRRGQRKC